MQIEMMLEPEPRRQRIVDAGAGRQFAYAAPRNRSRADGGETERRRKPVAGSTHSG